YVRCGRCSSVFNALARLTEEGLTSDESVEAEPPASAASQTPPPAPSNPPPQGATDEDAIPEDALEFDPTTTDVASVFVEPPPNPRWTAATGTFQAMVAANQEPAPGHESDSRSQEAAPAQESDSRNQEAAPPQDSDAQVDVEIDPELLASILHIDLPEPPAPREAAPPPPGETPPPAARNAPARRRAGSSATRRAGGDPAGRARARGPHESAKRIESGTSPAQDAARRGPERAHGDGAPAAARVARR